MVTIAQIEEDENTLYVGVIGYSTQTFDETEAAEIIQDAFADIENEYIDTGDYETIAVVSGLTDMGIPKIAYEVADELGYETIGIAPDEARNFDLYDVDQIIWSGEKFGDESSDFIDMIDVLVKIGGGEQSDREMEMAEEEGISVLEFELDSE